MKVTLHLQRPTRELGGPRHRSPIWPCSGWGLPGQPVTRLPVVSYTTFSPLPAPARLLAREPATRAQNGRRYVSVALSLRSPSLGVTQHPALWSPDFPRLPVKIPASATTRPTRPVPSYQRSLRGSKGPRIRCLAARTSKAYRSLPVMSTSGPGTSLREIHGGSRLGTLWSFEVRPRGKTQQPCYQHGWKTLDPFVE